MKLAMSLFFAGALFSNVAAKAGEPIKQDCAFSLAPAGGVFDLNGGTLEARIALDYSFDEYLRTEASACSPFVVFSIFNLNPRTEKETDLKFDIKFIQVQGRHAVEIRNNVYYRQMTEPRPFKVFGGRALPSQEKGIWWKAGEWHALAVTWRVENESLTIEGFLDGKPCGKSVLDSRESEPRTLSPNAVLLIGAHPMGMPLSPATIQALRISSKVRTPDEIASQTALKRDEATTFFFDAAFAGQAKKMPRAMFAQRIKTPRDIGKGLLVGDYQIIACPQGQAVQFYKRKSR